MLIGLALASAAGLRAQNLPGMQVALAKVYGGRTMMLRTFRSGTTLHFSPNGGFIKGGRPGPWTVDAYFQTKTVKLKPKALRLIGRRVVYAYVNTAHRLQPFWGPSLTLEIRTDPTSLNLSSLQQALGRVFAPPGEKLVDLVPGYWRYYLQHPNISSTDWNRKHCKAFDEVAALMLGHPYDAKDEKMKGITRPEPLYRPEPPYTHLARKERLQGTIVFETVVGAKGRVKNEMLIKPLGLGVDEQAVQTLRTWTFKPATRAGKPIRVAVEVEFSFRLF